jgi:hypothetical protein
VLANLFSHHQTFIFSTFKLFYETGRSIKIRYNKYLRAFKYGISKSKFTQHVLSYGHSFGKMEDIMNVIHLRKKGSHLNTMEKFCIYTETKMDNRLNDKNTVSYNKIFKTVLNLDGQLTGKGKQSPVYSLNMPAPQ